MSYSAWDWILNVPVSFTLPVSAIAPELRSLGDKEDWDLEHGWQVSTN